MHASFMPHSLIQLEKRLWIGHVLNTSLLTFILQSESSFLFLSCNILLFNLQSLLLNIVSNNHIFLYVPYHFFFY